MTDGAVGESSARTAFVLGGGGQLGAHEVGQLMALFEREIQPDLIIGTSIGALNGAMVAADPTIGAVEQLTDLWSSIDRAGVFDASLTSKVRTLATSKTHVYEHKTLRLLLAEMLPVDRIEDLTVRFECVAASIERAAAHYFGEGPLVEAVLASAAVPGLLPPVEIDGEHYLDGGLVASIPLDRAVTLGATVIYVLQVGRVEEPLSAPRWPWEVAMVAFEISRRHRFAEALASMPPNIEVHLLPTGEPKSFKDLRQYRSDTVSANLERIERSHQKASEYLDQLGLGQLGGERPAGDSRP